jgi:hypothetical protein
MIETETRTSITGTNSDADRDAGEKVNFLNFVKSINTNYSLSIVVVS